MLQGKIEKKVAYETARSTYPGVSKIEIDFAGMGDSFDHFTEFRLYDRDLQEIGGPNRGVDPTDNQTLKDYFFDVLNFSQYVTFNDEGSFGTITMDLDNMVTKLECTWYGTEEYDEETEEYEYLDDEETEQPTEYF
jgi:hypothetical protein